MVSLDAKERLSNQEAGSGRHMPLWREIRYSAALGKRRKPLKLREDLHNWGVRLQGNGGNCSEKKK